MQFTIFVTVLAIAGGAVANPVCTRDEPTTVNNGTSPLGTVANDAQVLSRCDPCNDIFNECMNHWPCWFYDCNPKCVKRVCESSQDCRQGCGYHC
ncbi:hypothetical protein BU23DRAFT_549865 [Bimuria novae-zelandiae CBS 107.79]|uniref:ShKT domain-containing protein n=1 Tax=Bimuria novae-zelandiae CBS 107.79 TaxID=1447943 RepID=A0A6A5VM87_9PLEO|nr:hypothetical protein BU23DRAFT_549865 [Bimuria novae-zelandiae CBS 107.79]